MIRDFAARTTGADAESLSVAPDALPCLGVALLIFLMGVTMLLGVLWLPLQWRDGDLVRLVGVLWAVPAAVLMTTRHAAVHLKGIDATRYLRRMGHARLAAIALALAAYPVVRRRLVDGQGEWMTPNLAMEIALSLTLCLCASVAAQRIGTLWFQLPLQPYESRERSVAWDATAPRPWIDRPLIISHLWRCWLAGTLLMCGALAVHQHAPDMAGVSRAWGMVCLLLFLGLGPLLIGQAARNGRSAEWQIDRVVVAAEVLEGWGVRGLTLSLLALAGAGLLCVAGLFNLAHGGVLRLASLLGVSPPHGPAHVSLPAASGAQSGQVTTGASPWAHGGGGWGFGLPFGLPHLPAALFLLCGAVAVAWCLLAARRYRSHGISRWLVLAAIADACLAYLGWLCRRAPRWVAVASLSIRKAPGAERGAVRIRRGRTPTDAPTTPRQAVIAQYLASLGQTARRGYPRRPGQTPHQHAAALREGLRREQQAPAAMADLFTAVRFGPQECGEGDAQRMRRLAQIVRRNLRRR